MTTLYKLLHFDGQDIDGVDYLKSVGVYSTEADAKQAIERLRNKPGFRDHPERWRIWEVALDENNDWREGFDSKTHEPLLSGARPDRL